nr:MAG TPA: hypothetical protein [Siphoviridae sp. ctDlU28]
MYYKCELIVGGYSYDVTNNLVNWDDVEMSFKRNDYDGVVRSFSNKFKFANGAYSLLLKQYTDNYLKSNASIVFYIRNNSWLWNEKFRCALDFSTFSHNGTTCEINAVDNSLASLIKAKKGTQYEYNVNELKEGMKLSYDRLQMSNTASWLIAGDTEENDGGTYITNTFVPNDDFYPLGTYYAFPLYIVGNPEIAVKNIIEVADADQGDGKSGSGGGRNCPYIFKNISSQGIKINIKAKFYLFANSSGNGSASLRLRKFPSGTDIPGGSIRLQEGLNVIEWDLHDILINGNGGYLSFLIYVTDTPYTIYQMMPYASDERLTIDFMARDITVDIDVIKPISLINRLLTSINGGREGVTCEISSGVDNRLDNTLIVAAESIRGIKDAKIYTSYTKFVKWMEAEFGFVPVISENKVIFVHRDSLFQNFQIKDFADNSREFEYSINSSLIYSGIKVGYEKQDYDSVNGRDEFHFTNEYSTGITLTDNVLDLISPYRADAYGIEFLTSKRGEDTTDSKSDNDIFFVCAELSEDKYKLIRIPVSGVISPDTMFNAMYSQRYMIKANEKFIGAFTDRLEFASSEGNSDIVIDGVSEKADILISGRSFTVGELSFETGDIEILSDLSGYVVVTNGGKTYKGYLSNVSYNLGRSEAVKYTLIVKEAQ